MTNSNQPNLTDVKEAGIRSGAYELEYTVNADDIYAAIDIVKKYFKKNYGNPYVKITRSKLLRTYGVCTVKVRVSKDMAKQVLNFDYDD